MSSAPKTPEDMRHEHLTSVYPEELWKCVLRPYIIADPMAPNLIKSRAVADLLKTKDVGLVPLILLCDEGYSSSCLNQLELVRVAYGQEHAESFRFLCKNCKNVEAQRRAHAAANRKWLHGASNEFSRVVMYSNLFWDNSMRNDRVQGIKQFKAPAEAIMKLAEVKERHQTYTVLRPATEYEKLAYYARPAGLVIPPQIS